MWSLNSHPYWSFVRMANLDFDVRLVNCECRLLRRASQIHRVSRRSAKGRSCRLLVAHDCSKSHQHQRRSQPLLRIVQLIARWPQSRLGNRVARSDIVPTPFKVSTATLALNSGWCCFRFDISNLLRIKDQKTTNRNLRQCPNLGRYLNMAISSSLSVGGVLFCDG